MDSIFDVAIIGGGINGCGCAADAALRGLSVILLEQDDLASKTSSSSTKLIHGGLRYLENYEFNLVKKAIVERQRLLDLAPHLVQPQALVLPYEHHMRPAWFLRLGLFLYDHLTRKNRLPKCRTIHRNSKNTYFSPLKDELKKGFLFYDATTDDARLTIVNAIQAKNNGASIRPYSKVIQAQIVNNVWQLLIQPQNGSSYIIYAKSLINAAGPWVKNVEQLTHTSNKQNISLVKGSHIIVPQIYTGNHAYFLQHDDKRIIFVIPYHGFSMIGTTDIPLIDAPEKAIITEDEINYLIALVNTYFKAQLSKKEILSTWSGVRALLANDTKEARTLSRDYYYEFNLKPAPVVTIFGGKITTYRQLAAEIIDQLVPVFPKLNPSITSNSPLPGAVFGAMDFTQYINYAKDKYQWMDATLLQRCLYTYGSRMEQFLIQCTDEKALGKKYGKYLYQVEIDYLIREEWARSSEDILKRRTKLGLTMDAVSKEELEKYLEQVITYPHPAQTEILSH